MPRHTHRSENDAIRWCFEDRRTGKIVIGQAPNLPMILALIGGAVELFSRTGSEAEAVGRGAKVVGFSTWALAEVVSGVNPWRRALGTVAGLGGLALASRRRAR